MKKILIFSLAYYPHVGGAEVAVKEITDRIADLEFHMMTLRFSKSDARVERLGNVIVHRVGRGRGYLSKIFFAPAAAAEAVALHRELKFDVAWVMMSYMLFPLMLARLIGFPVPYALTLQEGDTEQHMFGRLRILPFLPILRSGFRNAKAVSAISTFLVGWAKKMGYRGEVDIIPNGADVRKFAGERVAHEGTVLITSSRLVHKNAVDDCLRALAQAPGARFRIAGTGPDEAMLKALARELGVEERVEWLGYVGHDRLPALLHESDIFVRPSRSEGFGSSFVEAFAAGIPVITTREGGLADFITPEVAYVVEKDRPDQVAARIKEILGNPARAVRVVESARRLAFEKYDWGTIARDMRERVFSRLFHE